VDYLVRSREIVLLEKKALRKGGGSLKIPHLIKKSQRKDWLLRGGVLFGEGGLPVRTSPGGEKGAQSTRRWRCLSVTPRGKAKGRKQNHIAEGGRGEPLLLHQTNRKRGKKGGGWHDYPEGNHVVNSTNNKQREERSHGGERSS